MNFAETLLASDDFVKSLCEELRNTPIALKKPARGDGGVKMPTIGYSGVASIPKSAFCDVFVIRPGRDNAFLSCFFEITDPSLIDAKEKGGFEEFLLVQRIYIDESPIFEQCQIIDLFSMLGTMRMSVPVYVKDKDSIVHFSVYQNSMEAKEIRFTITAADMAKNEMNAAAYASCIDHVAIEIMNQAVLDLRNGSRDQKKDAANWLSTCGVEWGDVFGCRKEIENLLYNQCHTETRGTA